jgi:xanthine dehydrogenase YagS FAD-binding subunit
MNRFAIATPESFEQASTLLLDRRFKLPILKAGGMDVVDHLKEGLIEPDLLVNIKRTSRRPGGGGSGISVIDGIDRDPSLEIDATTTLIELMDSRMVQKHAPVLGQSVERAATPQVRNVATVAGNLLQRPRCWYYRNDQFNCLKKGGSTCFAAEGENRYHAIFGDGPCHIVHPSNLAPALMVCGGVAHLVGGNRDSVALADLFHMPDKGIRTEHNLEPGEIVTHISCAAKPHSGFWTIKEKQSFDWPLVCAAAALELDGSVIRAASICAGAVAPVPWMLPHVADALKGVNVEDDAALRKACDGASNGAKPMTDNAYKLTILPVAVRRAVLRAAGKLTDPEMEA